MNWCCVTADLTSNSDTHSTWLLYGSSTMMLLSDVEKQRLKADLGPHFARILHHMILEGPLRACLVTSIRKGLQSQQFEMLI